ncbi:MAG: hypothetical protein QOJ32_1856 [Frankiaceae bacterium]|nr:hypothetical protein [Frankiaceae bacterium]
MTVDEPGKAGAAASDAGSTAGVDSSSATVQMPIPGSAGAGHPGSPASAGSAGTAAPAGATKHAGPGEHRTHGSEAGRSAGWAAPEPSRSRRLATTALAALGIAIGAAVVVGLLLAFLARDIGSSSDAAPGTPSLTLPDGNASAARVDGVPADWTEQTTRSGLVVRAPPGWTQRTDAVVDYRVDPNGPEQVGVGLSRAGDPDVAVTSYVHNTSRGQTAFATPPAVDATGARGERARQLTVTYTRQGTPVTVVVRGLSTARGVVVVATRSASDNPDRAVQLVDSTDASFRRP